MVKILQLLSVFCFSFSLSIHAQNSVVSAFRDLQEQLSFANNYEDRAVGRMEWNSWQASRLQSLSEEDIISKQANAKEKNKRDSRRQSRQLGIVLDECRQNILRLTAFCQSIPKGGLLHVHPSGTINKASLRKLLTWINPTIDGPFLLQRINQYGFTLTENERKVLQEMPKAPFLSLTKARQKSFQEMFFLNSPVSFERFDSIFVLGWVLKKRSEQIKEVHHKIYHLYLSGLANQNISYVEFTNSLPPQVLPHLDTWSEEFKQIYGVEVRWNKSFVRSRSVAQNKQRAQEWIEYMKFHRPSSVVGIDLLANEKGTPALEQAQFIYTRVLEHNKTHLPRIRATQHAGELGHPMNPRDAMLMGSERLGHGVLLRDDPLAMEFARQTKVAVEINLVSNKMLMAVADLRQHPFTHYARIGIPVALSTDNDGIFQTNPARECRTAVQNSDVEYTELKQIYLNSIIYSFVDQTTKEHLLQKLKDSFKVFENKWKK